MKYLRVAKDRRGKIKFSEESRIKREFDKDVVLVLDTWLAIDHAMRFVTDGCVVYYWLSGYIKGAPLFEETVIGDGFPLEKIEDWGGVIDKVGLVYVTDNVFPQLALHLRERLGKRVYGPTPELVRWETDRVYGYQKMKEKGINVPPGKVCQGKKELIQYIDEKEKEGKRVWVKVENRFRGQVETFSVSSASEAEAVLGQVGLGPYLDEMKVLVQEDVEGVEIGCDAWVTPEGVLEPIAYTIEKKKKNNVAVWQRKSDFIDYWYGKVIDVIQETDYRCNLSVEGIWNGRDLFVLEPTSRNAYPSSNLYSRFVKNWVDVVWAVAEGRVVEVEVDWDQPYMVQFSVWTHDTKLMRIIDLPEELVKWDGEGVGFRRVVYKDGKYWYVPGSDIVATVNAKGKTLDEAFKRAEEMVQQIKSLLTVVNLEIKDEVKEDLKRLEKLGEKFRFEVKK
jgi:phosphoribosylamine-glycine ligase